MKIHAPLTSPPAGPAAAEEAPAAAETTAAPIDTAERAHAAPSVPSIGVDAGAARVHLAEALRHAQPIAIDARAERALAELVRTAALEPAAFPSALAAFVTFAERTPSDRDGLLVLLTMRQEAVAAELTDPAPFLARCARIAATL
jgi:hypothetical protein